MEITKKHFELDKFNIEREACQQASLYQYYAECLADKQKELDKANLKLEQSEAEFKIKAKEQNPKLTVEMLNAGVMTSDSLNSLRFAIIDIKHELAILKTAVSAMEQKRSMIEVESRLQNNRLFQEQANIGDHSSAEWAEEVLRKQINQKANNV